MSPDFPSVARVAAQLFPQSGGGEVDGVISLDPVALQDLLDLTGPVVVGNRQLDSGNVVQFLYHDQYVLGVSQDERANLLGEIAHATFDKLTHGRGASPSEFANEMSPALRDKDLTMWFANAAEQKFTVRIGGDGSVPAPSGDSFGVIVQNAGANKLDAFLERSVVYSATVDADSGRERARAAITLHNTAPSSGLPDYVIGNEVGLPTGTTRLIVAAYSRLELQTATIDGRALTLAARTRIRPKRLFRVRRHPRGRLAHAHDRPPRRDGPVARLVHVRLVLTGAAHSRSTHLVASSRGRGEDLARRHPPRGEHCASSGRIARPVATRTRKVVTEGSARTLIVIFWPAAT